MHKLTGELLERIRLNRQRLGDDIYRYPQIFHHHSEWPGDFEGRAILSLCSLYRALTGYPEEQASISAQLSLIFDHIDEFTNEYHFFGKASQESYVDEQQISGNSWFIRGLCAYYNLTNEEKYLEKIRIIAKKYLLKIAKYYNHYPSTPRSNGGVSGQLTYEQSGWKVSTDIGCAFIMMDGASQVYELIPSSDIKQVVDTILQAFLQIDFVHLEFQTHATLSFTRGLIRMYEITQESHYLEQAMKIFKRYHSEAMTEDYANINWFNRPDSWTEPCCIIDSMIVSKKLYLLTKNDDYLKTLNQVYINSIRTFQRDNGGAGCSTCAIGENHTLRLSLYEAYFCCSMRLGEGFAELYDTLFIKDNALFLMLPIDVSYQDVDNAIDIQADIYRHSFSINVIKAKKLTAISLYLPAHTHDEKGEEIQANSQLHVFMINEIAIISKNWVPLVSKEHGCHYYGDMLLTISNHLHKHDQTFTIDGEIYSLIANQRLFSQEELRNLEQRIKY